MAKIKVTKVNFTPKVKDSLNDSLVMSMFGDEVKNIVDNLPYEQEIWIDTNEICCIDTMIVENAFIVHFKGKTDKDSIRIKAECFDELLKAWKGE